MSTLTARVDLPPAQRSVPAARHAVLEVLGAWAVEHYREDAALVSTELLTNVIDHAGSEASMLLELTLSDGCLTISVADSSAVHPVMRELCGDSPRGRGIQLVAAVADRWGCEDHHGGKRVWAQLQANPRA